MFNDVGGYANRGTFLVDRDGTIAFADVIGPGESRTTPSGPRPWPRSDPGLPRNSRVLPR